MAKERPKNPRIRLFVALDLPRQVQADIAAWGRGSLQDPVLRSVGESSLHITLAFLGHREKAEVDPIAAVVRECGGPAPELRLGEPEQRPLRGPARVYVLPVRSDGVEALQADLQARLVGAGLHEAAARPFWPHVTVARVRTEGRGSRRPALVERPPNALPQTLLQSSFEAVRLTFYRSELQPRGARYVPLAQVELPSLGQQ
jgi:2'-5' RNA ligase